MEESCNIWARRRNSETGQLTNRISKLHQDLLSLKELNENWDRKRANAALLLSQNKTFRKEYIDELMYDEDSPEADTTIVSLYEIAPEQTGLTEELVLGHLNKKFESGDYSYDDARMKVNNFNSEGIGGSTFMATLSENPDGSYHAEIVINNRENQNKLLKTLSEAEAAQTIIDILEQRHGVTAVAGIRGMYSTEGPIAVVNGMKGLIQLKGGRHNLHQLATETGHFIIGSIGEDNQLYQRLSAIIRQNPDVIKAILGEERTRMYIKDGVPSQKYFREMIGHIVGKYLEDNLKEIFYENPTIIDNIKRLLQKLVDFVKSKFAFTDSEYKNALYNARYIANNLAKNFLQESFQGNLETALKTEESLDDLGNPVGAKSQMKSLVEELRATLKNARGYISNDDYKNYNEIINDISLLYSSSERTSKASPQANVFDDIKIVEKMATPLFNLAQSLEVNIQAAIGELQEAKRKLDQRNFLSKDLSALQRAAKACQSMEILRDMYDDLKSKITYFQSSTGEANQLVNEISEILNNGVKIIKKEVERKPVKDLINEVREQMALHLLSSVNGGQIFNAGSYIENDGIFKLKRHGFEHLKGEALSKKLQEMEHEQKNDLSLIDLYSNLNKSFIRRKAEWWSTYIMAMIDNPDIINQYLSIAVDTERHKANVAHLEIKGRLMDWYRYLKANNIKMSEFFELEDNGKKSGNLVSELNWGEWEKDWEIDYQKWKDDYYNSNKKSAINPEGYENMSEMYNDRQFITDKKAWTREWHSKHSTLVELTDKLGNKVFDDSNNPITVFRPASKSDLLNGVQTCYDNFEFIDRYEHDSAFKTAYDTYMDIKKDLDALLPIGSTNYFGVRAPQFENTTIGRLKTSLPENAKKVGRLAGKSWRTIMNTTVLASPEEIEFGTDGSATDSDDIVDEINGINTDPLFERKVNNKIQKLPIYGVKKFNRHFEERGVDPLKASYYDRAQNLSMDLVQSTMAYSAMANSYASLENIADIAVQLAKYVNENRTTVDLAKGTKTKYYDRLENYVNQQIFNNYESVDVKDTNSKDGFKRSKRKMATAISVGASYYFLGWNYPSAMTNLFTGINEIVHEARSREHFTKRDLLFAMMAYAKMAAKKFIGNIINVDDKTVGTLFDSGVGSINESTDKAAIFLKYMDAQNDLMRDSMDYFIDTPGYQRFAKYEYGEVAMMPYSIADGIMQSIAFLATAHHTKLRDKETKQEIRLFDAYKVKKVNSLADGVERSNYTLEIDYSKYEILSESKERSIKQYLKLKKEGLEGSSRVFEMLKTAVFTNPDNPEKRIIPDEKLSPYIDWTIEEEAKFQLTCRGINNRMHGIYNRPDGGAYLGTLIGPLMAVLKKYAIGMIDARYSRTRVDVRSGSVRSGVYGSVLTLIKDNFSTFKSDDYDYKKTFGLSQKLDDLEYKNFITSLGKVLYGLYKTTYMIAFSPINYSLDAYMESRGFSKNAVANIRRFWSYVVLPAFWHFIRARWLMPPKDDEPVQQSALAQWVSDQLMKTYIWSLRAMPGRMTIDDDELLDREKLNDEVKTGAFSVRGILAYHIYRAEVEQLAYSAFLHPERVYSEYRSLSNTSLAPLSAVKEMIDVIIGTIPKSAERVEKIAEAQNTEEKAANKRKSYARPAGKKRTEPVPGEGWEIKIKQPHKDWFKTPLSAYKHLPFRTLETWWDPYLSIKNYEYYLNIAVKGGGR